MPSLADLIESANTGADAIQKAPIVEENTGVRCLRIGDVSQRKPFQEWGFTNAKPDIVERFQLKKGDIIIARTGNTIGVNKFIRKDLQSVFNNGLIRLRVNTRSTEPEFIYYNLQTDTFREFIHSIAFGTSTQPNMQIKDMLRYEVANIAKKEQKAIVYILRTLDDKIELNQQMNETLEAMAQALFKSWFLDFDSVAPEDMCESEMGLIPKGWNYCSLKEIANIYDSKRIPLSGAERAIRQGIFPYYGAASLMDYVDDYLFEGVHLLVGEDGSVVDAGGYPVIQYVWGKFWVNNHAHILQGKDEISTEHLMLAMKQTKIQPYITGAVQPKLSQSNMWRINFLRPSKTVATRFNKIITPMYENIRYNQEEIKTLSGLRDTLLPKLISGQLRIKDAEKYLESHI